MRIEKNYIFTKIDNELFLLRCDNNEIFILDERYENVLLNDNFDIQRAIELVSAGVIMNE